VISPALELRGSLSLFLLRFFIAATVGAAADPPTVVAAQSYCAVGLPVLRMSREFAHNNYAANEIEVVARNENVQMYVGDARLMSHGMRGGMTCIISGTD
jgi:hypothetical protein